MYINGNFLFLLIFSVYSCFIMLLVSVAQWSESATRMYTYIPPLFGFPLQLGHHRALSRVSLMHGMFYVKVLHNCKSFPIKKFHRSKGVLFFLFFFRRGILVLDSESTAIVMMALRIWRWRSVSVYACGQSKDRFQQGVQNIQKNLPLQNTEK